MGAFDERRRLEEQSTAAVQRIERLVSGSFSKGRVGENLLKAALNELPPDMVVQDFRIGGRVCEFGLRMSDGRVLPVDSKWGGFDLVEQLETAVDLAEREGLRKRVDKAVCERVGEVADYIDASLTVAMAVIAVPDAVYACCRKAHRDAAQLRVTILSYGTALPVLLSIWNLHRAYARELDSEQLIVRIHEVANRLGELAEQIEGRLSRALTTATNAASDMRAMVSSAQSSLRVLEREAEPSDVVPLRLEASQ